MRKVFGLLIMLLLPLGLWAGSSSPASVTEATVSNSNLQNKNSEEIQKLQQQVEDLSKQLKILKAKDEHLVLGNLKLWGYLRMRYLDDLRGKYSALSIEEMTLNLVYHPAKFITAWMNFWVHPNQLVLGNVLNPKNTSNKGQDFYPTEAIGYLYIERAQAEIKLPSVGLYTHSLRIGKWYRAAFGIPPSYPNRKISDYSLVSEAFTHDRVIGIDYIASYNKMVNFAVSVYNGLAIGARNFGPSDPIIGNNIPIIADREIVSPCWKVMCVTDNDYNKEVSMKLGYQWPAGASYRAAYGGNGKYFQFDVFGTIGNKLTKADKKYLTDPEKLDIPSTIIHNNKKFRAGADARLVVGKSSYDAEFFKGWTGGLQTIGFQVLGVYKLFPGRLDLLARYAELDNINVTKTQAKNVPALWNKRQIQLSVKVYLAKWAWIQTEYYFNFEGPTGDVAWVHKNNPKTRNDVFFIEMVLFYM